MSKHASLGRTPEVKRSLVGVGGAIAVGALILAGTVTVSLALENKTALEGRTACFEYCAKINKTAASLRACEKQFEKYWYCNGSDAKTTYNAGWCKSLGGVTGTFTTNPQTRPLGPAKIDPTRPPLQTRPLGPAKIDPTRPPLSPR